MRGVEGFHPAKRILMTADAVGGVWTYALELTKALAQYNIEVNLAVMGQSLLLAQQQEARALPNLNLFKSEFRLEWMLNPWRDVDRAGDWLLHLENRLRPDVVHLNGFAHAALSWKRPALVVAHSCVFSWWRAVHGSEPNAEWEVYRSRVTRGLRSAKLIVAPTQAMLSSLVEHYGRIEGRVIPNGIDAGHFRSGAKEEIVFTSGRVWDTAKNIESLIQIAPKLNWPVYVAGEYSHPGGVTSEVDLSGAIFLGRLQTGDVRQWLSRASIYALPAHYEPFGLSILEAALSGCALVLGDIPSLRENWSGAAIFVPPNDRTSLQAEINRLISNERQRSALAKNALERARDFSSTKMAEQYVDVYSELLQSRPTMKVPIRRRPLARSNVLPVANI